MCVTESADILTPRYSTPKNTLTECSRGFLGSIPTPKVSLLILIYAYKALTSDVIGPHARTAYLVALAALVTAVPQQMYGERMTKVNSTSTSPSLTAL